MKINLMISPAQESGECLSPRALIWGATQNGEYTGKTRSGKYLIFRFFAAPYTSSPRPRTRKEANAPAASKCRYARIGNSARLAIALRAYPGRQFSIGR